MLNKLRTFTLALMMGATFVTAMPAHADTPGRHPFYVHAMSDLRNAYGLLNRPSEWNVVYEERNADREIRAAYNEIRRAAADDAKDWEEPLGVDANLSRQGRLHQAETLLWAVRRDIDRAEDNPAARGWRNAARMHVDRALAFVRHARHDARWDRDHGF